MILICNCEPCCMHSRSKGNVTLFYIYSVTTNLAACILVPKGNVTLFYIYSVTANLAALILVPSEPDLIWMAKNQRLLARPPNSKFIINICFISGPKAAKLPKFLYSKFPNCFGSVYIYVFSAPRRLIAIFCLFSCFLLLIRSRTCIGSADWGAVWGHFFFSSYVLLGLCPHLQLSLAKEMNTADTVKLP